MTTWRPSQDDNPDLDTPCRIDGCRAWPKYLVVTDGGGFQDVVCGKHLDGYLVEALGFERGHEADIAFRGWTKQEAYRP